MAKGGKKGGSSAAKSASAAAVKLQEDVWAQCDNPNCQKWRRLPPGTIIDENTPWYCYMNPDEEKAACEAPEESYTLDVELEYGYEKPEARAPSATRQLSGKSKGSSHADKGKSSSRGYQHTALAWQGAQRSHSGSSSQGTKRHADSDAALDPPYKAKRARVSNPPAPKLHPRADANGRTGPAKSEADSGSALGSDLLGSSSAPPLRTIANAAGVRHSLRPKRPPSYPLKEESPPPQGPPRQGSSRQGQGGSRPPSGQSQKAQAAATRPTQKARKQHKGFEKLLALGGLWEIVKGKGKAITPAPFWVWEGLATHTPAAAELAAQAADVASAARYFEGSNYPTGAAQAAEAASLKRQAMAAAAVLGLDATSQIPDVVDSIPSRAIPAAATAAASKPQPQPAAAVQPHTLSQPASQATGPLPAGPQAGEQLAEMPSLHMPSHGRPESLSHILAQPQSLSQSQPSQQSHSLPQSHPEPSAQSLSSLQPPTHSQAPSRHLLHSQPQAQLPSQSHQQPHALPLLNPQAQQQQQLPSVALQSEPQLSQAPFSGLQSSVGQSVTSQSAGASSSGPLNQQQQHSDGQLLGQLQHQSRVATDSGAQLASWPQPQLQGHLQAAPGHHQAGPAASQSQTAATAVSAEDRVGAQYMLSKEPLPNDLPEQKAVSCNALQIVSQHKLQFSLPLQNGRNHQVETSTAPLQEGRPPDGGLT